MIGYVKSNKIYKLIISSKYSRLIIGSFWSILGAMIFRGASLLSAIFVARIVGKQSFGEFGIIQSTVGTFAILIGLGLGMTSTKYIAQYRESESNRNKLSKIVSMMLIITYLGALITCLLIVFFKDFISTYLLGSSELSGYLILGSAIVFFNIINSVQTSTLSGFEAFKTITKVNLITGFISFPITLLLTYFFDITGTLLAIAIISFITWILNVIYIQKEFKKYKINFIFNDFSEVKYILKKYTLPATLSGALPTVWIANVMLVNSPEGFNEMAYLSIANNWHTLIMFLPISIGPVLLSLLSNSSKKDESHYWEIVKHSMALNFVLTLFATIGVIVFADILISLYGREYENAKFILILMTSVTILKSINHVIGQVIATSSSMWLGFGLNLIWGVAYLIITIYLVDEFGSLAIGFANIGAYALLLVLSIGILNKIKNKNGVIKETRK